MKNGLDEQYIDLLKDILENGVEKNTRNGKVLSVFGRSIRYKFKDGKFPLLTTKKMAWKTMVTELLWFLRGDTNIKYLVDNDCNIWNGDAYKNYLNKKTQYDCDFYEQSDFILAIKTDDKFAKKWGELGPIYGKQWRNWEYQYGDEYSSGHHLPTLKKQIDQIQNLINDLKTNPDSRRLMVSAWNVGELDQMVLPPCHYSWQVYTRELTWEERSQLLDTTNGPWDSIAAIGTEMDRQNLPKRAISLMWNQRSVDTFLGLPFNIASYGLLLEIIAKAVNMVPDELIGNLGDVHLYSNHIEQAKEQIGRKYTAEERTEMLKEAMGYEAYHKAVDELMPFGGGLSEYYDFHKIPHHTREPYPLPTLKINTEFWSTESGEWNVGPFHSNIDRLINSIKIEDFKVDGYQSHPTIKAPLSN